MEPFLVTVIALVIIPLLTALISTVAGEWVEQLMVDELGQYSQVAVGGLGVIIHELGHLLMALLFHHRIIHVKLLTLRNLDATQSLGSVSHIWNQQSWWQDAGNFFIGIAPFYSCSLVMWLIHRCIGGMPWHYGMPLASPTGNVGVDIVNGLSSIGANAMANLGGIFTGRSALIPVYLVLSVMVASTGYGLSKEDWRSTLHGLPYWLIAVTLTGIIAGWLNASTLVLWEIASFDVSVMVLALLDIGIVGAVLLIIKAVRD